MIDRVSMPTRAEAKREIFDFIGDVSSPEAWYNPHRRHSSLGQVSPLTYETQHQACLAA
jgi:putative transposase